MDSAASIDLSVLDGTVDTINFSTASGSEFQVRYIGDPNGAYYQIDRMGLTSVQFIPFAATASINRVEVGFPLAGRLMNGGNFTTSRVTEIAIFQGAAA